MKRPREAALSAISEKYPEIRPAANREQHFQVRVLLLERQQPGGILCIQFRICGAYSQGTRIDHRKRIVQMREQVTPHLLRQEATRAPRPTGVVAYQPAVTLMDAAGQILCAVCQGFNLISPASILRFTSA